jgi:glycine/D-amino acid oxidase-like deaminating enzyme
MKPISYWLDTAPAFRPDASVVEMPRRADVAVIGAGLTGLSSALALAKRGAAVVVLEAGRVVGEASGRNGGQCNAGALQDYRSLVASVGAERASRYYREFAAAVETVARIAQDEGIDCDFRRSGKLKLAVKAAHYESMQRTCEALQSSGVDPDVTLVPPSQLRAEIDSTAFHGGLLQSTSAQLHVGRFGVGLAQAAQGRGVRIFEQARVDDLQRLPAGGWRVTSTRGSLEVGQVLVATGGSGPGPFGWFRRRIVPVGSFIVVTEPLGRARLDALLPGRRSYVSSLNIGNYFRETPDERLLFGGRARFAVSNPKSDIRSGGILHASLERFFPALTGVRLDYCWGGSVDMSMDRLPRAGERDGLFYAMGYSGHGVQMAVHMGQVMADVMDGRSDSNPWHGLRWPPIPAYWGKPWFLPAVGAWYRLQDVLH